MSNIYSIEGHPLIQPSQEEPGGTRLSPSGGGGDNNDGMEARVARLEAAVSHVERDVGELRSDMRDVRDRLTRLEERVSHLPRKEFIVASLLVALAVIAALIAFQGQIQRLVGIAV